MFLFFAIFFIVLAVFLWPKNTVSDKIDPDELQDAVDLANKAFQERVQNMKIDDALNPPLRDKTP